VSYDARGLAGGWVKVWRGGFFRPTASVAQELFRVRIGDVPVGDPREPGYPMFLVNCDAVEQRGILC